MKRIVAKPLRFDLHDTKVSHKEPDEQDARAVDMDFWCPNDGYKVVFGVAVSREHYERILDLQRQWQKGVEVDLGKVAKN